MNDKISVIIPVYNVDAFIAECLDSVLAQEHQNFEVIMVNDGSTDRSGEICDAYAEKDDRFSVIHTENRGVGQARNLAMEKMTGEYCFFLDPDDLLEPYTLSYLLTLLKDHNADIALGVSTNFSGEIRRKNNEVHEYVHSGKQDIIEGVIFDKNDLKPLNRKSEASVVNWEFFSSLYRTELIKQKKIEFLPISYGEDTYVAFCHLLHSKIAVTSSRTVYWHRRNTTSTTFRYHENYLEETKRYYKYYASLFEQLAPEYLDRVREGLNAQYFRRCISAIERELFISPKDRTTAQKVKTIRQVRTDDKFSGQMTKSNLRYTPKGRMRVILNLVKNKCYHLAVLVSEVGKK